MKKKSRFAQSSLVYLGHIISDQGVAVDMEKVDVMLKWPAPHSLKELCGFLGLIGYYRCFMENYGSIAWPLTELLRKENFQWGTRAEVAFQTLKDAMTQILVLALPDFSTFIVETDASSTSIGAISKKFVSGSSKSMYLLFIFSRFARLTKAHGFTSTESFIGGFYVHDMSRV